MADSAAGRPLPTWVPGLSVRSPFQTGCRWMPGDREGPICCWDLGDQARKFCFKPSERVSRERDLQLHCTDLV